MKSEDHRIIILADIEGSSGCSGRESAKWMNREWVAACRDMTLDLLAVLEVLESIGIRNVTVADFHRTGHNLFPDMLPPWVNLRQGYRAGPIPGIGAPPKAERAFFIGMHAAGGTGGFLAHTLTSRFLALTVNDRPLAEIELFAASLGRFGIAPALFSGCAMACVQAQERIPGLPVCPVPARPMDETAKRAWRRELAAVARSAAGVTLPPYRPTGPFRVRYRWRGTDEEQGFTVPGFDAMYDRLLKTAYYQGLPKRWLPLGLRLQNLMGRWGLAIARRLWERTDHGRDEGV